MTKGEMKWDYWLMCSLTSPLDSVIQRSSSYTSKPPSPRCDPLFSSSRLLISLGTKEPSLNYTCWENLILGDENFQVIAFLSSPDAPSLPGSLSYLKSSLPTTMEKSLIDKTKSTIFWPGGTSQNCKSSICNWAVMLNLMVISLENWF